MSKRGTTQADANRQCLGESVAGFAQSREARKARLRPGDIVVANAAQLRRIGKLVEGVTIEG